MNIKYPLHLLVIKWSVFYLILAMLVKTVKDIFLYLDRRQYKMSLQTGSLVGV